MMLYVLYAIGAVIALSLGLAASRPDSFRIERSTTMNATPDRIASNITDLHRWTEWSPWEKLDPALQRTYSGSEQGKGAIYEWEGNKKVGAGRMEVTDVAPDKVAIKLDFLRPFKANNMTEFLLTPIDGGTKVTWVMRGPSPFTSRVFGLVINMDKLVGTDFERGLASLKQISETSASA